MVSIEQLVEPVRHSPQLPKAITLLQAQLSEERRRRDAFYAEMTPEQKIEFIDGDVILHSPVRNKHLDVTKMILKLLDTHVVLNQLGTAQSEKCLCVFPRNDYEPDIVFFGREKTNILTPETVKFPVPDMAIEILSSSTEARDRGVKFEDYAANGVQEYWIVDADGASLEQYVLRDGRFQLLVKSSSGKLSSVTIDGFTTDIEALFDTEKNVAALRAMMA